MKQHDKNDRFQLIMERRNADQIRRERDWFSRPLPWLIIAASALVAVIIADRSLNAALHFGAIQ